MIETALTVQLTKDFRAFLKTSFTDTSTYVTNQTRPKVKLRKTYFKQLNMKYECIKDILRIIFKRRAGVGWVSI